MLEGRNNSTTKNFVQWNKQKKWQLGGGFHCRTQVYLRSLMLLLAFLRFLFLLARFGLYLLGRLLLDQLWFFDGFVIRTEEINVVGIFRLGSGCSLIWKSVWKSAQNFSRQYPGSLARSDFQNLQNIHTRKSLPWPSEFGSSVRHPGWPPSCIEESWTLQRPNS